MLVVCAACLHGAWLALRWLTTPSLLCLLAAYREVAAVRALGEQEFIQCVAFDPAGSFVGR